MINQTAVGEIALKFFSAWRIVLFTKLGESILKTIFRGRGRT
ncbi:MAG: hypothetical protein N4A76_07540 [Firmicutes bacterium]|nr:hypothetical protein [Bacillota bacterium]